MLKGWSHFLALLVPLPPVQLIPFPALLIPLIALLLIPFPALLIPIPLMKQPIVPEKQEEICLLTFLFHVLLFQ